MSRTALLVIVMIAAAVSTTELAAKRTRTTRAKTELRTDTAGQKLNAKTDTIDNPAAFVDLSGYEKTLRSRREAIYAANLDDSATVTMISIDIEYLDMQGRQLHRRTVDIPCSIPPGQRRLLTFPSWDRQFVMYYRLSKPTRTSSQATCYDVRFAPLRAVLSKP